MATQARTLGTPEGYALAVASYLDIGENERAGEVVAVATADLPIRALACSTLKLSHPDQNACSREELSERVKWYSLAAQMHRLGQRLPGLQPAGADRNIDQSRLVDELLAAGVAPARLADMSLKVSPSDLMQGAFARWAEGDPGGARSLLALVARRSLSADDAQDAARLAAALGNQELQLAFVRDMLTKLQTSTSRNLTDALLIANAAVYWRENLPDVPTLEATR